MMNRKKTKKAGLIKYALILPVTLTLILWSNAEVVSSSVHTIVENLAVEAPMVEQQQQQEEPMRISDVSQRPQLQTPRNWSALNGFLNEHLRYPQTALTNNVSGQVALHFIIEADGSVNNVEMQRGDEVFFAEAARLMRLTRWQPGRQDGRAVRVRNAITLVFNVENGEGSLIISPPPPPPIPAARTEQRTAPPPPPPVQQSGTMEMTSTEPSRIDDNFVGNALIIINGEKQERGFDLSTINARDIESFTVLRGVAAIELYGEEGRDGVIIVTTRNNSE